MSDAQIGQLLNLLLIGLFMAYLLRRIDRDHRERMAEIERWGAESKARHDADMARWQAEQEADAAAFERERAEWQAEMAKEEAEWEREEAEWERQFAAKK